MNTNQSNIEEEVPLTPVTQLAQDLCGALGALPASERGVEISQQADRLFSAVSRLETEALARKPVHRGLEHSINLLRSAAAEIKNMRRTIEILRAKEEVLCIFARATGMTERNVGAMGEDIVWEIELSLAGETER